MIEAKHNITTKGSSTRNRIVEQARKLLIEKGYEAFVMRELADTLGIKLGNLQYYFKTKEVLILEIFNLEAMQDVLTIQGHQQKRDTATEAFSAIVQDLVARWRGSSGVLFSILGTLALHNTAYKQLYRTVYQDFYLALEDCLGEMNPDISQDEVQLRVRLITALIDGSPMQTRIGKLQDYLDRVQAQAELIALA